MEKIIIILGATAVGKSEIAIQCASKLNGEIISADSMQVYKELNIGTAKIKKNEMQKIPHHLINIKHFNESYNVWEFVSDCNKVIEKILSKNKVPIIVGGTNLYVKALIENYHFDNIKRDNNLREKLNTIAEISGLNVLYEMLKKQNPAKAKKISSNDKYRILRALECSTLQDNESENAKYLNEKPRYDYKLYALNLPREKLYELINKRVDLMIGNGLFDEVKDLKNKGLNLEMQAGKSIGYREFLEYLDGKITYEYAVEKIKQHSRNYAKRQYTWLNSMENIIWLDALDKEKAVGIIIQNENLI
ncbi:MAG: tRNA (adenosine(37)-N6)-dimethylallyltransferase MiaA [Clostridia bacterium]|nr:tRNA (adenosine(37)-N6)-dimethylallyltransferase MiaA [Clostridia bacterium]